MTKCPAMATGYSVPKAVAHSDVALAFLASVDRTNVGKKTVVASARRALNAMRAFLCLPSLVDHKKVNLLAKASTRVKVTTTRQSPGIPSIILAAIIFSWGQSRIWWKRQTTLMILTGFLGLARGAGVTSCLRDGISWVLCTGMQSNDGALSNPSVKCDR